MNGNNISILVLIILITLSCNTKKLKYEQTNSGLKYSFIEKSNTEVKASSGDAMVLYVKCFSEDDSLVFDSDEIAKNFRMKVPVKPVKGSIEEGLKMMSKGDSASFIVKAGNFYRYSKKDSLPKYLKENDNLIFFVRFRTIISKEQIEKEIKKHNKEKSKLELRLLSEYITRENIDIEPSMSGLYKIILDKGKGNKAEYGDKLIVHYTGKFITGEIFDDTKIKDKPFEFILGKKQVIDGWEEGLSNCQQGDKIRLIIPSHLAYGEKGKSIVPPFSTLIFDIEILDIQ